METKMYRKDKGILVTILSLLIIPGFYFLYIYKKYLTVNPNLVNDLHFWGKAIIIMMPIVITVLIIIHLVFFIINKIITNQDIPTISDEMDKLIDLKAIKSSRWVNSLGFILAIGSQAVGMQPWVLIVTLISSGILGGIIEGVIKIYYYRKGV